MFVTLAVWVSIFISSAINITLFKPFYIFVANFIYLKINNPVILIGTIIVFEVLHAVAHGLDMGVSDESQNFIV